MTEAGTPHCSALTLHVSVLTIGLIGDGCLCIMQPSFSLQSSRSSSLMQLTHRTTRHSHTVNCPRSRTTPSCHLARSSLSCDVQNFARTILAPRPYARCHASACAAKLMASQNINQGLHPGLRLRFRPVQPQRRYQPASQRWLPMQTQASVAGSVGGLRASLQQQN